VKRHQPLDVFRQARIRQPREQNRRSLRPVLRGNHRPQAGAGQQAAVIMPGGLPGELLQDGVAARTRGAGYRA